MSEGKPKGSGVVTHPDVDTVLRNTQQKAQEFIDCLTIDADVVREAAALLPSDSVNNAVKWARQVQSDLRTVREARVRDAA